jgi:prevent-host-death family protein
MKTKAAKTVTIHQAKTNLSKLIKQVSAGEEIIIARGKEPVARLIAVKNQEEKLEPRPIGLLKGKFTIGPEFFEPLSDEELEAWGF